MKRDENEQKPAKLSGSEIKNYGQAHYNLVPFSISMFGLKGKIYCIQCYFVVVYGLYSVSKAINGRLCLYIKKKWKIRGKRWKMNAHEHCLSHTYVYTYMRLYL